MKGEIPIYKITVSSYMPKTRKFYVEIVMDAASDLESVSTDYAPGSIAVVADEGLPAYMLNASGEWKEL